MLVAALCMCVVLSACEKPTPPSITTERKMPGEPNIRVRIERESHELTLTAPTKLQIYSVDDPTQKQLFSTPIMLRLSAGQWLTASPTPLPRGSILAIDPLGPSPLAIDDTRYPGTLRLVPETRDPRNTQPAHDRFDVINHVRLEAYLPGVLDRELYDHWQPSTFLAQAIAARSYAISRMIDFGPGRHYDVENTQASQAYSGIASHPVCIRAVADTMGLVLTHDRQVIPAYYSSTCGGLGQSDADAFGSRAALPPFIPAAAHSWCQNSRYYRWGPIQRNRTTLSKRMAAWGRTRGLDIAKLQQIVYIRISETNPVGRPVEYEITDSRTNRYRLRGESFRHACNFSSKKLKLDPPDDRLLSSYVKVERDGDTFSFTGHGFGHGVGLCQYGAEGMARSGHTPQQILATYYPGAQVERAY